MNLFPLFLLCFFLSSCCCGSCMRGGPCDENETIKARSKITKEDNIDPLY